MTLGDRADAQRDVPVLVVSTGPVVAAAFAAGLVAAGWSAATPAAASEVPAAQGQPASLVVVTDECGAVPEMPEWVSRAADVVVIVADHCVGPFVVPPAMQGAAVVDASQPLQGQLRAVTRALDREYTAAPPPVCSAEEAARVATLTVREAQILDALMTGASAAEVADLLVVSLPTVRTHIRSILSKLGVSSQLAAVALACRVRCRPWVRRCRTHQI